MKNSSVTVYISKGEAEYVRGTNANILEMEDGSVKTSSERIKLWKWLISHSASMESASIDYVADQEKLYRRVRRNSDAFQVLQDGRYRVTSQSFGDRKAMQPSVDRAILRGNDPRNSRLDLDDCILGLVAGTVRTEVNVPRVHDGILQSCVVDVVADPTPENISHAVITAVPTFEISEEKLFRRLKQALAALAT